MGFVNIMFNLVRNYCGATSFRGIASACKIRKQVSRLYRGAYVSFL